MLEVSRETFADEVLQSDLPVLVDFWGPLCGPCLQLMPEVEALAEEYAGRVKVVKLEAPRNRRLCLELRVMALPTYLGFAGGREVARVTGDVTRQQIVATLRAMHEGARRVGTRRR